MTAQNGSFLATRPAGVFLGGVLSQGPGWRWVLFVNLPPMTSTPATTRFQHPD